MRQIFVSLLCFFIYSISFVIGRPSEDERVRLWHERNQWPPTWQVESDSYRQLMEFREEEIMSQLTGADERWENWMQYIQARMLPTFTETGFEVIQCPKEVYNRLRAEVDKGLKDWDNLPYEEGVEDSIYASEPPKFISMQSAVWQAAKDLLPLHEAWAGGVKLRPTSAYGVRMYQNGSTIVMHNDKCHTHVISSIIHLAHHYDNDDEPWPIQIEDHDGNLHAVSLEEGQMLFYESAKCLHGRMRVLKGKYYGSLFVHYQPVDKSIWDYSVEDVIANVPPHWREGIEEEHGSRWAGQAITTDSRVVDNAPPRVYGNNQPAGNQESGEEEYADFGNDEL